MNVLFIITSLLITTMFCLLGAYVFPKSYLRFGESCVDLYNSIKYYFCKIFDLKVKTKVTVLEPTHIFDVPVIPDTTPATPPIPETPVDLWQQIQDYFTIFGSGTNFDNYLKLLANYLLEIFKGLVIVVPLVIILCFAIKKYYETPNNRYNKDTLPLKTVKLISAYTYQPAKRFVTGYIDFLKHYTMIPILWLVLSVFNLNVATIIFEFLAYYFYFSMSFKFKTIYPQLVKFTVDAKVFFTFFPWWVLLPIFLYLFGKFRKKIALQKLRHFEAKNCGFIKELPIVSMTCGSMGKKKTTVITDMALSQEKMFRQKAFEIIQNNDYKFPYFPWILLENDIKKGMEDRTIFNLASIRKWLKNMQINFEKEYDAKRYLYGYDYKKYGLYFNDNLKQNYIFDVLINYAQAYFIYIIQSSLLVSNYSIRGENKLISQDNFPLWSNDFFPKESQSNDRYSHILDFDVLRLGKKVYEENKNNGSFEFGVIVITEIGKERGNNLELKEVKKKNEEANQKNDLFNSWLKMCRHSATVDNYPFIKVFTDEQRPESWGADARDLADIITIVSSGEQQLTIPFYSIEEMLYEWAFNRFNNLYYNLRFTRGDNTLFMYTLKLMVSKLFAHNIRIYNQYGYCQLKTINEDGKMSTFSKKKKYYIMNKKIYSRRFSTDCFSDYFNDIASKTNVGINDYTCYMTERASVDELKQQHSYFIDSLYRDSNE